MGIIKFLIVGAMAILLTMGLGSCKTPLFNSHSSAVSRTWADQTLATYFDSAPGASTAPIKRLISKLRALLADINVSSEAIKLYALWVIGAPSLVLFILILMLLRPKRKISLSRKGSSVSRPAAAMGDPLPSRRPRPAISNQWQSPQKNDPQQAPLTDTQQVLHFFMQLFKHQQNLAADAPCELKLIEQRTYCPNDTYEMRVLDKKEWITRRMSIGLLGSGGGSRSKCFYVIFDSHLVIKIPPEPVTEFEAYKRQMAAEGRIVARLAPRLCIVPRVSVILKNLVPLVRENSDEEQLEAEYIHLLEKKPALQEYLKVGNSFVFFMDLAKYFFLSTTLEEIHRPNVRLLDEILSHPDLLWDHNGFAGRYGEDAGAVCHELQEAYQQSENQWHRHLAARGISSEEVPHYIFKQWFLHHLAGERMDMDPSEMDVHLVDQADAIIENMLTAYPDQIQRYRSGLEVYIRSVGFSRHRRQLENLASNTLDLLAWIIEKDLALRDLKPENLFVAGNPKDYPAFLNDTSIFSIGLIDVETAVVLKTSGDNRTPQPQLAGTPLYALPTHLLSNAVLSAIYGDVRTALQLQDWHATIAITYKLITGKNLFIDTARVFPEIVSAIKAMEPAGFGLEKQVIQISRLFWNSATAEFQEAIRAHKAIFGQIKIRVPEVIAPPIQSILAKEIKEMEKIMADLIAGQSLFSSGDKLQFLKEASAKKISQMKNRLILERDRSESLEGQRSEPQISDALIFFKQLDLIKRDIKRKQEALVALESPRHGIAADLLLDAMFSWVFHHMYPSHWPALAPARHRAATYMATDITTYQATL